MRVYWPMSVAGFCCSLGACAAAPPPQPTTARTEIVIDEPEVVRAHATAAPAGGLPPLPVALERTSAAFQRAFEFARPLLDAPAPATAPDDSAAYGSWLDAEFKPWLLARGQAVEQANAALGAVASGPASERVVGGALVGLIDAHVHEQLIAVPAPPELRADEKLVRIYQNEIHTTAAGWLEQALISLRDCADHAARQADPVFGAWLGLCQEHMASVQQAQADAAKLSENVALEREADRVAAEGPRPPGPELCCAPPPTSAAAAAPAQPKP